MRDRKDLELQEISNHGLGVDGGNPFAVSKSTRCHRAAQNGIVAAVANLGFLDSFSSHLMVTGKKIN
ncbi:hypothetical protein Y032_0049g1803 [Ancylostoma ceylanicum]|nr:hypothetical protein Y032_0049g1803 [Ancylostoma ceylanicum]